MLEPTYRQALTQAWQLAWRHKVLWILGLMSVLLGQFGVNNYFGKLVALGDPQLLKALLAWWHLPWAVFVLRTHFVWMGWLFIILGSVLLLVGVAGAGAQAASLHAAADWYQRKTTPRWGRLWSKAGKSVWRLLALNIFLKIGLGMLLLVTLLFVAGPYPAHSIFFFTGMIFTFALLFWLAICFSASCMYAAGYIVTEDESFLGALRRGWQLFNQHVAVSVELSMLLLALNVVLFVVVVAVSMLVLIPAVLIWLVASAAGSASLWIAGYFIASAAFVVCVAIVGGIFNAFTTSAWMYLFMKMHREGVVSRMAHWVERAVRRQ